MARKILLREFYPHPPERVWKLLTNAADLERWLMPNDFEPRIGHDFTMRTKPRPGFDGIVRLRVLAFDPPHRMSWSWNSAKSTSTVTFDVAAVPEGTELTLCHQGFEGVLSYFPQLMFREGWTKKLTKRIPALLVRLASTDPTAEATRVYDAIARRYAEAFDDDTSDHVFLDRYIAAMKPGARVLDVGSGTGAFTRYLHNAGLRVEGVDISLEMVAIARQNHPGIEFRHEDIRTAPLPEHAYDGVWAGYSLFHLSVDEFPNALRRIRRALVPGGVLGLVMQEGEGEVSFVEPLAPTFEMSLRLYTQSGLLKVLSDSEYVTIDCQRRLPSGAAAELDYAKLFMMARASP